MGGILSFGAAMPFSRSFSWMMRGLAAAALVTLLASSSPLRAQVPVSANNQPAVQSSDQDSHLVSPAQLDSQVQTSSATRQKQIENLTQFLSTPQAEKAMKDAKIDPTQVKTAIPTLSNAELTDLSARADHAQQQIAAGGLSTLVIGLIILAIVLIILLAVYA
jgi:exonuclease VII large subunit